MGPEVSELERALRPLSYLRSGLWSRPESGWLVVYTACGYLGVVALSAGYLARWDVASTTVLQLIEKLELGLVVGGWLAVILQAAAKRSVFGRLLRAVARVEAVLPLISPSPIQYNMDHTLWKVVTHGGLVVSLAGVEYVLYYEEENVRDFVYMVTMYLPLFILYLVHAEYIFLLQVYRYHLTALNRSVQVETLVGAVPKLLAFQPGDLLELGVRVHAELMGAIRLHNQALGSSLLASITVWFFLAVSNLFSVVKIFLNLVNYEPVEPVPLAVYLAWFALFTYDLFELSIHSTKLQLEIDSFNELIYQHSLSSHNPKVKLLWKCQPKVELTAAGFFTLDFPLLHTMLNAAATYIVILIQFNASPPLPSLENSTTSTPPLTTRG